MSISLSTGTHESALSSSRLLHGLSGVRHVLSGESGSGSGVGHEHGHGHGNGNGNGNGHGHGHGQSRRRKGVLDLGKERA